MKSRRKFLKDCGAVAGVAGLSYMSLRRSGWNEISKIPMKTTGLTLRFKPYELHMRHVFTVAEGSRSTTPVMLTELEYNNIIGFGEASMPPYLGENHETARSFLSKIDIAQFESPFLMEDILAVSYTHLRAHETVL